MLMNLYRSIGSVVCLAALSIVGCSESGSGASASAVGDAQVQTASLAMTSEPIEEVAIVTTNTDEDDDKSKGDKDKASSRPATLKDIGPSTARQDGGGIRKRSGFDLSAGKGSRGDLSSLSQTANPDDYIVKAVPASLDLGEIGTGEKAKATFKLVNTGDKPMFIVSCKGNCGCTVPKCPKNTEIQPGASVDVEVEMTAGVKGGVKQSKRVDVIIEGQPVLRIPITADVVAYVEVSPRIIGPDVNSDGRFVIRSLDNKPFRILSMTPPLIDEGIDAKSEREPQIEHVLYISWDAWKEKGSSRNLLFKIDHPRVKDLKVSVRVVRSNLNLRNRAQRPSIATVNPENALAARTGNVQKILAVTRTQEDLELIDKDGATLLGLAASAGQTEIVKVLLAADAKANSVDRRGRTPLMAAIQKRDTNTDTLKALIAGGADVNAKDKGLGASVLSWAAGPLGSAAEVAVLLEAGSDVNAMDLRGDTPLMWAARFGNAETVKAIIAAGADVAVVNKKGTTALEYASKRRANESLISEIKSLLENGSKSQD